MRLNFPPKYLCLSLSFLCIVLVAQAGERFAGETQRNRRFVQDRGVNVRYYNHSTNPSSSSRGETRAVSTVCSYCLNKKSEVSDESLTIHFYTPQNTSNLESGLRKANRAVSTISYFDSRRSY